MAAITREVMKALRRDIEEALGNVANKHGVTLELGNGRFNDREGHFKLNITAPGDDGALLDRRQTAYDLRAKELGLVPRGAVIVLHGKTFTVQGFNEKARTQPVIIKDNAGTLFKAPLSVAKIKEAL